MAINNYQEITGEWALALRLKKGMNQAEFWAPAHVDQSRASRYEAGAVIPDRTKKLMFLEYIGDIPTSADRKTLRSIMRAWRESLKAKKE